MNWLIEMSETLSVWIFGIMGAWLLIISGGVFRLFLLFTQIQTTLIITSKEAAKILHSPDDHLGIDKLLEKYVEREHELTWDEWGELFQRCEEIKNDTSVGKNERILAMFVSELAVHKRRNRSNFVPQ